LLLRLGSPEQDDKGEQQDHRHPRKGGCHGSERKLRGDASPVS
jgi:hypothetical protein